MTRTALIAIGGNSLIRAGEDASVATERAHVRETAERIADMILSGWRVVLTHGNGPQVGAALLRSERASPEAYALPLDVCVAATQGEIGFLLGQALEDALAARGHSGPVVTVLTRVLVASDDPAFAHPTKPIGPHLDAARADTRRREGWRLVEDPPRGFRRVVASPEPLEVLEEGVVRGLIATGATVVTLGGGGIPVARVGQGGGLTGVEAVVDKDLASALLAIRLQVDLFLVLTDVDGVYRDFATPRARRLGRVAAAELRRYAEGGHFPAGSMGPKVEAMLRFVESGGGGEAVVTSPDQLAPALRGETGTHLLRGEP